MEEEGSDGRSGQPNPAPIEVAGKEISEEGIIEMLPYCPIKMRAAFLPPTQGNDSQYLLPLEVQREVSAPLSKVSEAPPKRNGNTVSRLEAVRRRYAHTTLQSVMNTKLSKLVHSVGMVGVVSAGW